MNPQLSVVLSTRNRAWFLPVGLVQGANMAVRKLVLEQLGGFDELLGAVTPFPTEDVEFLSRASEHGFTGANDLRPVLSITIDGEPGPRFQRLFAPTILGRRVRHEIPVGTASE